MTNAEWKRDFETRLRAVNWENLDHAGGMGAGNVPDELMKIVEAKSADVVDVSLDLLNDLNHQGTRYSATLAAVPFLAEMIENLPDKRAFLIYILVNFALGYDAWHHPNGFRLENPIGAYMTPEFVTRLYRCVQKWGLPIFLSLAQHDSQQKTFSEFPSVERDPKTEVLALWALGWFPNSEVKSRSILENSPQPIARFALELLNNARLPAELATSDTDDEQLVETLKQICQ